MDLFASLLEGNKKSFPWKTDSDNRQRGCIVKLMVRKISNTVAEHWALYFDWTDRAATYEANDEDGYLIPTWNRGYPNVSYTWTMARRFSLECSPQQVNSNARQLSLNGQTYLLTDRNCHHWAIALATAIGLDVDGALESYLPSDLRDIINFGYSVNSLTNFSSALGGSARISNSGHSLAMATAGSKVSNAASRSKALDEPQTGSTGSSSDANALFGPAAVESNAERDSEVISTSRAEIRESGSGSHAEDSTEPTLKAVGGAVFLAAYAIGSFLQNFTGDSQSEASQRDRRNNSRDFD